MSSLARFNCLGDICYKQWLLKRTECREIFITNSPRHKYPYMSWIILLTFLDHASIWVQSIIILTLIYCFNRAQVISQGWSQSKSMSKKHRIVKSQCKETALAFNTGSVRDQIQVDSAVLCSILMGPYSKLSNLVCVLLTSLGGYL